MNRERYWERRQHQGQRHPTDICPHPPPPEVKREAAHARQLPFKLTFTQSVSDLQFSSCRGPSEGNVPVREYCADYFKIYRKNKRPRIGRKKGL